MPSALAHVGSGTWVALVVVAVLVFWMLGAYNRLVAMRTGLGERVAAVDDLLQRRSDAATAVIELARGAMPAEQGTLDAWLAAQTAAREASERLRLKPVQAPLAQALTQAESPLAALTARVHALLDQQPELLAATAAQRTTLRDAEGRLVFARQLYSEAAQAYNEAVRQFPTRLLARLYGFGTAGLL